MSSQASFVTGQISNYHARIDSCDFKWLAVIQGLGSQISENHRPRMSLISGSLKVTAGGWTGKP